MKVYIYRLTPEREMKLRAIWENGTWLRDDANFSEIEYDGTADELLRHFDGPKLFAETERNIVAQDILDADEIVDTRPQNMGRHSSAFQRKRIAHKFVDGGYPEYHPTYEEKKELAEDYFNNN